VDLNLDYIQKRFSKEPVVTLLLHINIAKQSPPNTKKKKKKFNFNKNSISKSHYALLRWFNQN